MEAQIGFHIYDVLRHLRNHSALFAILFYRQRTRLRIRKRLLRGRYLASSMGRFLSPDPMLNSGRPSNPQTWNRYSYALNNPLKIVDPTGLYNLVNTCAADNKQCNQDFNTNAANLKASLAALNKALDDGKITDLNQAARLSASLYALGTENDGNNVNVKFGATGDGSAASTVPGSDASGKLNFTITFDPSKNTWNPQQDDFKMGIDAAHEGTHVSDTENPMYNNNSTTLSAFQLEYRGYQTSAWAANAFGQSSLSYGGNMIWNKSWGAVDDKVLTRYLTNMKDQNGNQTHPDTDPAHHNPWTP